MLVQIYPKSCFNDLAVIGGNPAFNVPLHVGRPNIGNRVEFIQRINAVLDSGWLTNQGGQVAEFERRVAEMTGAKHCVAVCNATIGLGIVAKALGWSGEVIMPSLTFVATAHAMQWMGLTPRFCDVDPETRTLDAREVERLATSRTAGILGVHLWGRSCDVEGLSAVARRYGLGLIFDAAHALGCSYRGTSIGSFGDAEVFSFHATKVANSFEGGAITTNNDDLAGRIRLMGNFGFRGMDNVVDLGTNGKMSEVSAAMGNVSLGSLEGFIASNRRNYELYRNILATQPGLSIVAFDRSERNNFHYIVVEIDEEQTGLDRDSLLAVLRAENVLARRYFWPGCHKVEPYRSLPAYAGLRLPVTEQILSRNIVLPTGTAAQEEDVIMVCKIIELAISNAGAVRSAVCARDPLPVDA